MSMGLIMFMVHRGDISIKRNYFLGKHRKAVFQFFESSMLYFEITRW